MHSLLQEALRISNEISGAVFIGAVGVLAHTGYQRESQDLDFAILFLSEKTLLAKGYKTIREGRKDVTRTPRRYKIDIYKDDVNGIPVKKVIDTAEVIPLGRNKSIKVAAIEILIFAKYKAGRPQDRDDLYQISQKKYNHIRWDFLASICTPINMQISKTPWIFIKICNLESSRFAINFNF